MGGHKSSIANGSTDAVVSRVSGIAGIVACDVTDVPAGALRVLRVVGPGAVALAKSPPEGLLRRDGGEVDLILPVTDVQGPLPEDMALWTEAAQNAALRDLQRATGARDVALTLDWDAAPVARMRVGVASKPDAPQPPSDRAAFGRKLSDVPALIEGAPYIAPDDHPRTLADAVHRLAASTKEIVAYRPDGRVDRNTYSTLVDQARRVQAGLAAAGLGKGDIVLCDVTDAIQSTAIVWGATLGGVVPALISVPEDHGDGQAEAFGRIEAAAQVLGHPPIILDQAQMCDELRGFKVLDATGLVQHPTAADQPVEIDPEDDAVVLLTSGSTGVPKGVVQSHRATLAMVGAALHRGAGIKASHTVFNWMPRDHVGSYMIATMGACVLGASQVHADTGWILADPTRWLDAMSEHHAGLTWSPNFSFALITRAALEHPKSWDLSGLKAIFNGGETVTEDVLDAFIDAMKTFGVSGSGVMIPSLGMSETCSAVTLGRLGRAHGPFTSLGGAVPGTQLRAVDPEDGVLCEGEIGRVQVAGPQLMSRYHRLDTAAISPDGWYDTGDLGFIADGGLYLTGRLKDTVNVNGATYFAHEIEQALGDIPGLDDAATVVTAVDRANDGEALAVFFSSADVSGRDNATVLAQLAAVLRDRLAARLALTPDLLIPIDPEDIPRTSIGKVVRRTLQDRVRAGDFDRRIALLEHAAGATGVVAGAAHRKVWVPFASTPSCTAPNYPVLVFCDDPAEAGFLSDTPAPHIALLHGVWPLQDVRGRMVMFIAPRRNAYTALVRLADQIANLAPNHRPAHVVVVTQDAVCVDPSEATQPEHALLPGLVQSLGVLATGVHWSLADINRADRAGQSTAISASRVCLSAFRNGSWVTPKWQRESLGTQPPKPGPWLVTGGLGGIGRQVCADLQSCGAELIIVGRTPEIGLDETRSQALAQFRASGRVQYVSCDLAKGTLADILAKIEAGMDRNIAGVIHLAARVPDEQAVHALAGDRDAAQDALSAVFALGADRPDLRVVTVGSIVGQVGGRLQAYAALNAALAEASLATGGLHHVRLDLSCWENRGMSAGRTSASLLHADGLLPLSDAAGVALMRHAMCAPGGHLIGGMDVRHPRHGWLEEGETARPVLAPTAWVGGNTSAGAVSLRDARGADHLVPLHVGEALPKTASGAVDNAQLLAGSTELDEAADDPVTQVVALAMADTLDLDQAPVSADFFALGGTSLLAARLAQQLAELFFVDLSIAHVFRAPRPAQLAKTLRRREAEPGLVDAAAGEILNAVSAPETQTEPAE
ncbi:AMP-binding protein [uncultured Tateyamaria sp.]|uniref:AMP-binding protein n=1 Tax=uncultured Tateyamaria sp. TaxID=455651 RepID=UPI00261AC432|nr:AMP-binding protein [uncultured Tateyamaria sp.]